MASSDERLLILKMIESGKISAKEGKRLLDALKQQEPRRQEPTSGSPKWLRVRVTNHRSGENRVSFNVPMRLVDIGLRMAERFVPDSELYDFQELQAMLRSGVQGKIFEADDQESNEHIEIFVE